MFLSLLYSTKILLQAFTQICTGLSLFWISFVLFFISRIEDILYEFRCPGLKNLYIILFRFFSCLRFDCLNSFVRYCGLGVWVAAFMVGMKLEVPEQRVLKFLSQLRFKVISMNRIRH